LDLAFLTRCLKVTALLALLGCLFAAVYVGWGWALGFLLGAAWGIGNLYLLRALIGKVVRQGGRDTWAIVGLVLIKFPLLYALGFVVLSRPWYPFWAPVLGFSLSLIVIVLKAAGRAMLRIEGPDAGRKPVSDSIRRVAP
jgi:hypothetical protein